MFRPRIELLILLVCAVIGLSAPISFISAQQVKERQVPFDSAGRVMEMTPSLAARYSLGGLSGWHITGDYSKARLYTTNDSSFVIIVTRRDGATERYDLSRIEVEEIRGRIGGGPGTGGNAGGFGQSPSVAGDRHARNMFVRNQVLLGLLVYGPFAARASSDESSVRMGTYLIVAGSTFLAATQLSGDITGPEVRLSTSGAIHGAASGAALAYAFHGEGKSQAFSAAVGGIAGTLIGVYSGGSMTESEAAGAGFGSDIGIVTALGVIGTINGEHYPSRISPRTRDGLLVAAGLIGYPIGVLYPRNANYSVTPGDISTLWVTGGLGALASSSFIANGNPRNGTVAAALTGGFILGTMAGDRLLVQRRDFAEGDATILGLGSIAGAALLGGVYLISDPDHHHPALGTSVATVGGIAGLAAAQQFIKPAPDGGHKPRVSFDPTGLILSNMFRSRGGPPLAAPFLTVRF